MLLRDHVLFHLSESPLTVPVKDYEETDASFTPSWVQQLLRAFAYGTQFTVSFLVYVYLSYLLSLFYRLDRPLEIELIPRMLLGMYYNGYILFTIFIGHTVGYFAFARDTAGVSSSPTHIGSGHCC